MTTTAFVPKHFPRTKLPSGRVLSDAQQHQYDVLRTVGGKLIKGKDAWYRADNAEKLYGLNATAMWKLVDLGLVECTSDEPTGGFLFLMPELAKSVPGPRYDRPKHVVREVAQTAPCNDKPARQCRACDGDGFLAIDSDLRDETPHNERLTRDSRVCTYCGGTGISRDRRIAP